MEMFLALFEECNTIIGYQVSEVILEIVVIVFHLLAVKVEGVVVEP